MKARMSIKFEGTDLAKRETILKQLYSEGWENKENALKTIDDKPISHSYILIRRF